MQNEEPGSNLGYEIIAQHNEVILELKDMVADLVKELRDQKEVHDTIMERLNDSVPDGDIDGHRQYHEAILKKLKARAEIWEDVQKSVAKWGVIGLLTFTATALWHETIYKIFGGK